MQYHVTLKSIQLKSKYQKKHFCYYINRSIVSFVSAKDLIV